METIPVVFFGTPDIAGSIVRDLISDNHFEVVAIVSQPDRIGGRGHGLIEPETKKIARAHNIPCLQPKKLKNNTEFFDTLRQFRATYFVVSAYGRIVPQDILDIPSWGCFNVHYSILPEYRGASPIQSPLLDGKKETGVTIQKMVYEMDAGSIVGIQKVSIDPFETTGSLFQKFMDISGVFTVDTLVQYHQGKIQPVEQEHALATFCHKINKEDGFLDITQSVGINFHRWQGYTPWPGLYFYLDNRRLVITKCTYKQESRKESVGTLVVEKRNDFDTPDNLSIPTKVVSMVHSDGVLILLAVKLEGKKEMFIDQFLQGNTGLLQHPKYQKES